ncbi:L-aspartate oxidase [Cuspidothrix issatschenkoi]|uniref:L-aspartate oxidase n=1 Tax=Cuspidothrix issatschenkoi CHARLIE-1 TaxID=2052836 RepID=A0A2S6CZE8_9CYAN|nr:L-aspartate oxidase [Cuspidothrix issatschenkoi]PPJ65126.1 L-aspartate oxidase [Cuspidothrix issatschenkoi CHARLIE-1]
MPDINIPNQFDVLVVGAGAAGLYTSLCLPESLQIGLITKETVTLSASDWAQGGIAAAVDAEDSPKLHIEDTLKAGVGLCDIAAVEFLAEQAPHCIQSLVNLGVAFDRHDNHLALTLEAAHSRPRVLHAADTTGREVTTTLTDQVLRRQNIQVIQQALALSLWIEPQTGQCLGTSLFYQGKITWIRAGAVILATGGGGQVFAQTTNPAVSTGDGVAIAWRAGAILRDLEFVQFHPTALSKPGRFLISEAVRGEGAHLVDDTGRRFAFDYHPAGELAPRDVVSRAIFSHLQKTATDPATANVWLDMRPIPPEKIRHRFPNIIAVCQHWGIDVFTQPIPVSPAAHYWMGGILTDVMNCTNIPGLYAIGETASTGVHGANRLASNSLLECIVFGAQMASVNPEKLRISQQEFSENIETINFSPSPTVWENQQLKLAEIRQKLPRVVWQSAGICREESSLKNAITQISSWQQEFTALPLTQLLLKLQPTQSVNFPQPQIEKELRLWAETRNLLDVGELILKSAAFRKESRGGHYRLDYPQTDPDWQVHTLVRNQQWWVDIEEGRT